jgi:hypothetical protein
MVNNNQYGLKPLAMENLIGVEPAEVLVHGPSKLMIDRYLWHSPAIGIVASYTPTEHNVTDHFGIFRGVDQVEAFAQATIVSCGAFSELKKIESTFAELKQNFVPLFISIGQVYFHGYLEVGDVFVSIGHIKYYKFRQMICDGRIYKAPKHLDLNEYFRHFNDKRLLHYDLSNDFKLIAELFDVTGRAIKKELFKKN